jgi:hypothetical protein
MKDDKKLNRIQKRFLDRLQKEAQQTFQNLFSRYFSAFIDSDDPEGKEVAEVFDDLDAKWKVYCYRKKLTSEAKEAFAKEATALLIQYKENKKQPKTEVVV